MRSEETLSSTQHETREGTFPSLEGGAKPNVAFNSKRITRSEPKLAGPALIFDGYSADLLCDADQSPDFTVMVVARCFLDHTKCMKTVSPVKSFKDMV